MIIITPPNPTPTSPITITVSWSGCIIDSGIQQVGTTFDIHFNYSGLCFATPPGGNANFNVGTLAPGTYNVVRRELYNGIQSFQETTSFQVSGASGSALAVPTLDPTAIGILAVIVVLLAARMFRR